MSESDVPETTMGEMIGNILIAAQAVHEENPTRETALVITKLEEAQMWAERADRGLLVA